MSNCLGKIIEIKSASYSHQVRKFIKQASRLVRYTDQYLVISGLLTNNLHDSTAANKTPFMQHQIDFIWSQTVCPYIYS